MDELIQADVFASQLTDRLLSCRELGHVWRPYTVEVVRERRRIGGYVRVMRCAQCKTERHQTLDSRGGVVSNHYRYADGYLAAHVEPGFTRDAFRLEAVTRWVAKHDDVTDIRSRQKDVS